MHPYLVTEVAGVSGTRDGNGDSPDRSVGQSKVFEFRQILFGRDLEDFARARPLERQGGGGVGHVLDLHLEVPPRSIEVQPAQRRVCRGHAERLLIEDSTWPTLAFATLRVTM